MQSAFLALLFIFWESTNLSVLAQSQDPAALLKLARELRDGATASSSLKEAAGFYFSALLISKDQFDAAPVITSLVDRQQDIFHSEGDSTPADSSLDSVKVYSSIAYELAELLEFSPALLQDFNVSSLELLLTAARLGNSAAQHKVSTIFGTGVSRDHLLPMDAGRSLVLEYMAALSGDVLANMGMGYRLMHGIGVVENCELALPFYEYAANIAADAIEKSAGYSAVPDRMKLSEATDPNARFALQ